MMLIWPHPKLLRFLSKHSLKLNGTDLAVSVFYPSLNLIYLNLVDFFMRKVSYINNQKDNIQVYGEYA